MEAEYNAAMAAVAVLKGQHSNRQQVVGTLQQELQFLNKVRVLLWVNTA